MKTRAESDECEGTEDKQKKVDTFAFSSGSVNRDATTRESSKVFSDFRLLKTCEALAWGPVKDRLKMNTPQKIARLHPNARSSCLELLTGGIMFEFCIDPYKNTKSRTKQLAAPQKLLCSLYQGHPTIHVSLSTSASRSTCCTRDFRG